MMGLAIARALFRTPPIVADIDADKRKPRSRPARRKPTTRPTRKRARPS